MKIKIEVELTPEEAKEFYKPDLSIIQSPEAVNAVVEFQKQWMEQVSKAMGINPGKF